MNSTLAFVVYLITLAGLGVSLIVAVVILATQPLDATTKMALGSAIIALLGGLLHGLSGLYSQPPNQKTESTETVTQVTKTETPKGS
jgi:hypothetical protein